MLTSGLQRLAGTGGDPVIGLQTAFGGGKTHTMLAVYHLGEAPSDLATAARAWPRLATQAGVDGLEAEPRSPSSSARPRARTSRSMLEGRPQGPHAVGLYRLAACRRSRA